MAGSETCDFGGSCHWEPVDCNQGLPDLLEPDFMFQGDMTRDPCCSVDICIHRNQNEEDEDFGNFVRSPNGGVSDAPPFIVGVGVGGEDAFQLLAFERTSEHWPQPGQSVSWDGNGIGFCRTLENVPAGTYSVWVFADWYGTVTEANERDNSHHSSQSFTLPRDRESRAANALRADGRAEAGRCSSPLYGAVTSR